MSTKPEGEGVVQRKAAPKKAEYYECVFERPPKSWELPDPVQQALDAKHMGWEVCEGQDKDAIRVKLRCPMDKYLQSIRNGEKESEKRRRMKTPEATVDKVERVALDVQELGAGRDIAAAQAAAKGQPV